MEHVQAKFDALNMQALALADDKLKQIAESASCTDAQNSRILQRTLEKANIPQTVHQPAAEPKKPVQNKKRKLRLIAAAAAAIITVTAAALGVSGRLTYNKPLAEKNFGILGAARLEEMDLPEPVTYTNGTVNATVEAALCDGNCVLVLMTMEAVDPDMEIDWDKELYNWQEAGCEPSSYRSAFPVSGLWPEVVGDQCWISMTLWIPEEPPAATMTLTVQRQELDLPDPELIKQYDGNPADFYADPSMIGETDPVRNRYTDGLEIQIPLTINTPVLKMAAENGEELYLSGFEIYADMILDLGYERNSEVTAYRSDGTATTFYVPSVSRQAGDWKPGEKRAMMYAKLYQKIEGKNFNRFKPETFNGLFDITDVTRLEFDNTVYNVTTD